ncbi:hypothetical protein F0562_024859 [Nyssa sinensis]|uniref:BHLH domain-containing protein n=1 Tax=Nyssa sinensis TaxID=561372 RepID=A0A5J5BD63_9ASTE|nr:hypothetical protein F0562_024859 [Nyssa sinensis]
MSQCIVPNWNLRHQRQEQVEGEEGKRSSHVHNQQNTSHHVVPMSNYEVAELTWQNGQLAMHGGGGVLPSTAPTKPTWGRVGDTLESIVHQATCHNQSLKSPQQQNQNPANVAPSGGKWPESSGHVQMALGLVKKRMRSDSDQCGRNLSSSIMQEVADGRSACASGTAARDKDTTMMTWPSFESPPSLKTKTTDDDSASHGGSENRDEEQETKEETGRSHSTRRNRAAAIHNQSERRRRDRINEKMKALQKLVPNASKTDKASMLDEVIEYLKQLQAQVQMLSIRNMPQMMMPLGMQQHIQMSLLARLAGMGVGLGMAGMGMLDMNAMARTAAQSIPPLLHPSACCSCRCSYICSTPFHGAPGDANTCFSTSKPECSSHQLFSSFQ